VVIWRRVRLGRLAQRDDDRAQQRGCQEQADGFQGHDVLIHQLLSDALDRRSRRLRGQPQQAGAEHMEPIKHASTKRATNSPTHDEGEVVEAPGWIFRALGQQDREDN